ncbi:Opy2 protein [Saccharomycopsis crataegensis]|uniref:Opy2 protein n=1 Tax=Saccharomycopsis crataegensis TaxID=43959 RepID=A0AAV5QXD3_9ASCO|nr:Opy2 protein [Saccharomycopsis crataegensis]
MEHQVEVDYVKVFLSNSDLFKRDDSGLGDGCVSCDDSALSCNCKVGQTCKMTIRTCTNCAYYKCISASKNVGGIVGGIIGGTVFLALIVAYIVWNHKKQKRSNRFLKLEAQDKELMEVIEGGEYKDNNGIKMDTLDRKFRDNMETPPQFSKSPGESYFGDKSPRFSRKSGRRASNYRNSTNTFTSLATSALSRASNIIPIAYVPGVKVRSTSTLMNNRSIVDDVQSLDSRVNTTIGTPLSTTTAVRAVPKLVDVGKKASVKKDDVIYEDEDEDYADDRTDSASYTSSEGYRKNNPSLKTLTKSEELRKNRASIPGLTHIMEEQQDDNSAFNELISLGTDSEEEEEVIKEITRGNTPVLVKYNKSTNRPSSRILEVENDKNPINPFDDEYEYKN